MDKLLSWEIYLIGEKNFFTYLKESFQKGMLAT